MTTRHDGPWGDGAWAQPPWSDGPAGMGPRGQRGERRRGGPHGGPRGPWSERGERGERGRGRVRRGDIRGLLLAGLLDGPAHGYELMSRLEERSGGGWRPSPGSVYPMLQQLEDEGLVRGAERDGRKVYELTDEGREQADATRLDAFAGPDGDARRELHHELRQLVLAFKQVTVAGSEAQLIEAVAILRSARQKLYGLLAQE